jgi:hypothetical protein
MPRTIVARRALLHRSASQHQNKLGSSCWRIDGTSDTVLMGRLYNSGCRSWSFCGREILAKCPQLDPNWGQSGGFDRAASYIFPGTPAMSTLHPGISPWWSSSRLLCWPDSALRPASPHGMAMGQLLSSTHLYVP